MFLLSLSDRQRQTFKLTLLYMNYVRMYPVIMLFSAVGLLKFKKIKGLLKKKWKRSVASLQTKQTKLTPFRLWNVRFYHSPPYIPQTLCQ